MLAPMMGSWLLVHAIDAGALILHVACFVAYRLMQTARARKDPGATLQAQQASIRTAWVEDVLRTGNGILGVQTLRNAMMATLFFASNTMFLVFGVLTLTAQASFKESWSLLDPSVTISSQVAQIKLLLVLLTLLAAFFCFISAVRLFSHASISIGTKTSSPERVIVQIDNAWGYQGLGVRCYYFAAPLLCWVFGAHWLVIADAGVIALMYAFDNAPARG
jgi:uncharacterized membrane protein